MKISFLKLKIDQFDKNGVKLIIRCLAVIFPDRGSVQLKPSSFTEQQPSGFPKIGTASLTLWAASAAVAVAACVCCLKGLVAPLQTFLNDSLALRQQASRPGTTLGTLDPIRFFRWRQSILSMLYNL